MGLQNFSLPGFISNNPILGGGSADALVSPSPVSLPKTWAPASSGSALRTTIPTGIGAILPATLWTSWCLTVPMTFDGVKVTPWAMYGSIGRDSFSDGDGVTHLDENGDMSVQTPLLVVLLPTGVYGADLKGSSLDRHR